MRDVATTALELLGLAAVVTGVALVYVPAAVITAGAALLAVAWLLSRPQPRRRDR